MPFQVELKNSEATLTAVVRERVQPRELSRFVPAACGEVWSFVRSAGLPKPGRHTALYLDAGLVEVGVEVSKPFVGNDRVHCSKLPSGRVTTTVHFGPYQRLSEAHTRIRQYAPMFSINSKTKAPNKKSPEPTAVGAGSSAVAVPAASRRWLFFR